MSEHYFKVGNDFLSTSPLTVHGVPHILLYGII